MFLQSKIKITVIIPLIFLSNLLMFAQQTNNIKVGNLYPGEIEFGAFELTENTTVEIKGNAANFGGNYNENLVFYGWIIDSDTREIVWDARDDFEFEDESGMYSIDEKEPLDAGKYEVYYASNNRYNMEINNVGDFISRIFSSSKTKFKRKDRSKLSLTVSGVKNSFSPIDPIETVEELTSNAIVSFTHVMDEEDLEAGFSLNDDTEVRIYSIGEGYAKNDINDLAWITNVQTHEIVWQASVRKSSHAGGGKKNYVIDKVINLPKGSYMLHYTSDDSHSFEEWNVMPPDDPQFWGATIWAVSEDDESNVVPFRIQDVDVPIVELIKVGNDEFLSKGFKLKSKSDIRILCLGEGYDKNDLADFGWIVNADTKEIVWNMNRNKRIKHAGGTKKNVKVEETIKLDKGNYIAYYSTDDSHSYEEWNSTLPLNKVRWGLTIWSENKDYELFDANNYKSESIIAEIIKVRDNKELERNFSLSENSELRIIAIGEGDRSEMNDYGWIEDENGNIIWEMTYRRTKNAGGASKNRIFNGTIDLKAGNYTLHYITDDSHSYNDWNSSPPDNKDIYGMTVLIEE